MEHLWWLLLETPEQLFLEDLRIVSPRAITTCREGKVKQSFWLFCNFSCFCGSVVIISIFFHIYSRSGMKVKDLMEIVLKQDWTNFFLGSRFLGRPIEHARKMSAHKQIARLIETQLESLLFALYYLNSTYNLHF